MRELEFREIFLRVLGKISKIKYRIIAWKEKKY